MKLKKGQEIVITSGAYSDYQIHAHVCALKSFDTEKETEVYLKLYPRERDAANFAKFVAWILEQKLVMEIKVTEWYLGDYGEFQLDAPVSSNSPKKTPTL